MRSLRFDRQPSEQHEQLLEFNKSDGEEYMLLRSIKSSLNGVEDLIQGI